MIKNSCFDETEKKKTYEVEPWHLR
jgi:hypothetical protein